MDIKLPPYLTRYPESRVIASVSGGKDSTAMAVWLLKESGLSRERLGFLFADTGWEHQDTYDYLDYLEEALDIKIERIRGEYDMVSLAEKKQRFPSPTMRFCTDHLKVRPISAYLIGLAEEGVDAINAVGIRAAESRRRAMMPEWEETHPYPYEAPIWRPIMNQTSDDCFAIGKKYEINPNPLYLRGANRVGCYPCIFARKSELASMFRSDPGFIEKLKAAEAKVGRASKRGAASFFAPGRTPDSFHDRTHTNPETGEVSTYPSAEAVRLWALDGDQPELDFGVEPACWSQYGLCE